ncbi:AbrB family transcriptional regulator [Pseudonocardiaceae bacterium YIM PH 21723]|nr:AbrB family transcriptional regulator [Pseudonocardiaceae bacterium YIM PH 21723]
MPRSLGALGWVMIVAGCHILGDIGSAAGLPAGNLLMSMIIGIALAVSGILRMSFPKPAARVSQVLIGVLMGSYLMPDSLKSMGLATALLTGVTLLTIALAALVAWAMFRYTSVGLPEAILGMVPGGSAATVSCAEDLRANAPMVAFSQYMRVLLVALSAPALVALTQTKSARRAEESSAFEDFANATKLVGSDDQFAGLVVLLMVAVTGFYLAKQGRLPVPALLGPMIAAAVVSVSGIETGFAPDGLLKDLVFTVIGLEVGLRFTRKSAAAAGRSMPAVLAGITALCVLCALMALGVTQLADVTFMDAYLATTPGGINAVLATAASTGGDVPVVTAVQALRLLIVVLFTPLLLRAVTKLVTPIPAQRLPQSEKSKISPVTSCKAESLA